LKIPLAHGVITEGDVVADYYDLHSGAFARRSEDEITLFKNGGGAHLDLMTARYVLDRVGGRRGVVIVRAGVSAPWFLGPA
jgi:ornithine cyclodeaminase